MVNSTASPPTPPEWTKDISNIYSPIRIIGKGGFASVWMAKRKTAPDNETNENDNPFVAIKVVDGNEYSKREVAILSELSQFSHPNIMRLLHDSQPDNNGRGASSAHCVVLSLARGPTLNHILQKNGAIGLVVAQTIARQLIRAVAFLHGHAVLHRDIQPSNIIISGARMEEEAWWNDTPDKKVVELARNCHITLIDFGFARALSPDDIDVGLKKIASEINMKKKAGGQTAEEVVADAKKAFAKMGGLGNVNEALVDTSVGNQPSQGRGRAPGRERSDSSDSADLLDKSTSHFRIRDLSALGTRNYAAPEILEGIRKLTDVLNQSMHRVVNLSGSQKFSTKKRTLGECVSDYGMVADAFSVGATIRHMVTGVPPNIDVDDFIASKNHPLKKLAKSLKKRIGTNTKKKTRAKQYRSSSNLPEEVNNLIATLTHYDATRRATVRFATKHPWIFEKSLLLKDEKQERNLSVMEHGGPIVYLKCGVEK